MAEPTHEILLKQEEVSSAISRVGVKLATNAMENVDKFYSQAVKCGYRTYFDKPKLQCAKTRKDCAMLDCPFLLDEARRELKDKHRSTSIELKDFLHL